MPAGARPGSFFGRFRAVRSAAFTNAVVVLYLVSAPLGAIVYLDFKVEISPFMERDRHWRALGLPRPQGGFRLHWPGIAACPLAVLAAHAWRGGWWNPWGVTSLLAFIVWWGFIIGHVMTDIMGFGS